MKYLLHIICFSSVTILNFVICLKIKEKKDKNKCKK